MKSCKMQLLHFNIKILFKNEKLHFATFHSQQKKVAIATFGLQKCLVGRISAQFFET